MIYSGVLNTSFLTETTSIIAMCDCGCGEFVFRNSGDTMFISIHGDLFSVCQGRFKNIKLLGKKLSKGKPILADIIIPQTDYLQLIELLENIDFGPDEGSSYKNISHIEVEKIDMDIVPNEYIDYNLSLVYDGSMASIVRNKVYQGFEICLKEDEFRSFVEYLKRKI